MKAARHSRSGYFIGAASVLALLATVAMGQGCSGDDRPSASTSGGISSGGAAPDGGGGGDGSVIVIGDAAACDDAQIVGGEEINEVQLAGDKPPPVGGSIALGRYILTELQTYVPFPADAGPNFPVEQITGNVASKNAIVTDTAMQLSGQEGKPGALGPPSTSAGVYSVTGTDIRLNIACPTAATTIIPYSASGNGLVLYFGERREIYKLAP